MIDKEKLAKVSKMAQYGDSVAIDFMMKYPDMDEEHINSMLTTISAGNEDITDETIKAVIDNIKDEFEAVDGYDKGIKAGQAEDKKVAVSTFEYIKKDELRHIDLLKALYKDLTGKDYDNGK